MNERSERVGQRMDAFLMQVATCVREQRQAAGMSQRELADEVGLTQSQISVIERRGTPELRTLFMLADVLGIDLTPFFAPTPDVWEGAQVVVYS